MMRKFARNALLLSFSGLSLITVAQAADEDAFLGKILPPLEQSVGRGHTALWTLSQVATQYQPPQPTPAMQQAIQAQEDGRFIEAMRLLEKAAKANAKDGQAGQDGQDGQDGLAGEDIRAETNLLRASFLLQGGQSPQALDLLTPLLTHPRLAANAYALTAMAHLEQGQVKEALEAAQHALNENTQSASLLPQLALSYALQGAGQLAQAHGTLHEFNKRQPPQAIALAREAELALTLDQVSAARSLVAQAETLNAAHPYVSAVGGLVHLIDGQAQDAKIAFEAALKRDTMDAKALLGLGLAEIKLGHFKQGLEKLQAAKDADPYNALILTYLGRAQQQAGQSEAAMESWQRAQQADPKDPMPWLYQAQAELQANRPLEARASLREAQARLASRSVYRGNSLLKEDAQLLQSNLAEAQRQQGLEGLAFHTLSDGVGEKNSANLRNQADALQGQRFGESARRSLLLQSMFNDRPGNLPSQLDIYGDGAGLTGGATPQHGEVSELGAQQASYNNYDALFSQRTALAADATAGNQNNKGEQVRLGTGSDTLGVSLVQRSYKTDGFGPFNNLNNRLWQGTVQWQPSDATQLFVSRQAFHSLHGETRYPADPLWNGEFHQIQDNSAVTRLGLRHSLSDDSELRAVVGRQQSDQTDNFNWMANTLPYSTLPPFFGPTLPFPQRNIYDSSKAQNGELQYRRSGADYATQWGGVRLAWHGIRHGGRKQSWRSRYMRTGSRN